MEGVGWGETLYFNIYSFARAVWPGESLLHFRVIWTLCSKSMCSDNNFCSVFDYIESEEVYNEKICIIMSISNKQLHIYFVNLGYITHSFIRNQIKYILDVGC